MKHHTIAILLWVSAAGCFGQQQLAQNADEAEFKRQLLGEWVKCGPDMWPRGVTTDAFLIQEISFRPDGLTDWKESEDSKTDRYAIEFERPPVRGSVTLARINLASTDGHRYSLRRVNFGEDNRFPPDEKFLRIEGPAVYQVFKRKNTAPEKKIIDGVTYHILRAPADSVKIIWKDAGGRQLKTFPDVAQYLQSNGIKVNTLMNGGIFEEGGVPSGLLIQDGQELRPVNTNGGDGNFFLKPNGIFLIASNGAAVIRTDEYPLKDVEISQAVQSGPLLLRHGKTHPSFKANSTSRLHRNGVGVSRSGSVIFTMTDFDSPKFPNLYEFAQLFRSLECDDALFLDGDLSQMRSGVDIGKPSNHFGSIIAVTETTKSNQVPVTE